MSHEFFKVAVLGPIAPRLFSVVASCSECFAAQNPQSAEPCAGFGPGCISRPGKKLTAVNRREPASALD
jgi:hypothetical protein